MATSYQGELEAIRIGTIYAKENISISRKPIYIYLLTAKQQYKCRIVGPSLAASLEPLVHH